MDIKIRGNKPIYMTEGAAGADVVSNSIEDIIVTARGSAIIPTGLHMEIPCGYEVQVRPRSGIAFKHDVVAVLGTIDSDYRGEIGIKLFNFGDKDFVVQNGERVGQIVVNKVEIVNFVEGELNSTDRGASGFGSTGK